MSDHRNPRPNVANQPSTDNPGAQPNPDTWQPAPDEDIDPRSYSAVLIALSVLGWYVSEIRPTPEPPTLWRVSIRRYDGEASISVTDADPDDALAELMRYASADCPGCEPEEDGEPLGPEAP